jgi:hypothetical protein
LLDRAKQLEDAPPIFFSMAIFNADASRDPLQRDEHCRAMAVSVSSHFHVLIDHGLLHPLPSH